MYVVEFCVQGVKINWCKFLMDELFQHCTEAQEKGIYLILGYFIMDIVMWKWKPLQGHELVPSPNGRQMAL